MQKLFRSSETTSGLCTCRASHTKLHNTLLKDTCAWGTIIVENEKILNTDQSVILSMRRGLAAGQD